MSVQEATDRVIDRAFGANPTPEGRESLLAVLTYSAIALGATGGILGALIGLGMGYLTDSPLGLVFARACGVVITAPLLGLSFVWACRWALASRERRRATLSASGVPGARDLLYAAPLSIACALFFAFV
jgi:predicted lipid-binding transport protein (Tim44 family)